MNAIFKLFFTFLKIGAFSFGGGNAVLPLMRKEVVINNAWISSSEFSKLIAISQVTPGPISVNGATYVGYRAAGILGSFIATLGVILPTFIIMIIFTKFFLRFKENRYVKDAFIFLRPVTVGLIAAAAVLLCNGTFIDYKSYIIFALVFFLLYKFKADPILITIVFSLAGLIIY